MKLSGADQLLKSLKEWLHNLSHGGEPMGGPFAMVDSLAVHARADAWRPSTESVT